MSLGYNNGIGGRAHVTLFNFLQDSPLNLRFELGYTTLNPGNAADARRIFINNATNGTPEKKGHIYDYRLDFMVPVKSYKNFFLNAGPRYSSFKGNFKFVGGNEDFDITSTQWGIGLGGTKLYTISPKFDFEVQAGFDYFIPNTLTGHDTSYSPDNENVNERDDNQNNNEPFTYSEADDAVRQPKYMPHLLVGISYKF